MAAVINENLDESFWGGRGEHIFSCERINCIKYCIIIMYACVCLPVCLKR